MLWAEEQHIKVRQKRDFTTIDPSDVPITRVKRYETEKKVFKRPVIPPVMDKTFNDELWNQQWYLVRILVLRNILIAIYKTDIS